MNFEKVEIFKTQMHVTAWTVSDFDTLPHYEIKDKLESTTPRKPKN